MRGRKTHPASGFWRRISTPRQEHQVGRCLSVFEERLARRAHLGTHRQTSDKVEGLARPRSYGKVRRDISRADPVSETTLHQRHGGIGCVPYELPDLGVVHKRRDAREKTSRGGSFLGRAFDGVPQEAGHGIAKRLGREERLCGESALPLGVRPENPQE
jgi:hypothetical protein